MIEAGFTVIKVQSLWRPLDGIDILPIDWLQFREILAQSSRQIVVCSYRYNTKVSQMSLNSYCFIINTITSLIFNVATYISSYLPYPPLLYLFKEGTL